MRGWCSSEIFIWWVLAGGEVGEWELMGGPQSGHLTLEPNAKIALDAYTRASEEGGNPEAQYKLGFLYGSNYGTATGGVEGVGKQGSVRLLSSILAPELNPTRAGPSSLHLCRSLFPCSRLAHSRLPPLGWNWHEAKLQRRSRLVQIRRRLGSVPSLPLPTLTNPRFQPCKPSTPVLQAVAFSLLP